ncbi:MAG: contact-dependent growth inhibition system immunity protein [Pseudomonadota bacterium]
MVNLEKTLQELERSDWGEPTFDSHLVRTIHHIRRVPLKDWTPEDFRIAIGQKMSLPILIPLALNLLENEPLVRGDYYDGDLLVQVFSCRDEIVQDKAMMKRATLVGEKAARQISAREHPEHYDDVSAKIAMFNGII